jgi:MFS transporter, NNP family, nitrate/nitrite transporter
MIDRAFFKAGHAPTLGAAFFYFDMSFMVWVMLGPLGVQIANDLHLDAGQKGLMVAVPLLAGALLRVVNGVLVDRIGPKATGLVGQVIVILGLITGWRERRPRTAAARSIRTGAWRGLTSNFASGIAC